MKKSRKSVYPAGSTWPLWWSSVQIKNIKKKQGSGSYLRPKASIHMVI
jgi:hypothetical protein